MVHITTSSYFNISIISGSNAAMESYSCRSYVSYTLKRSHSHINLTEDCIVVS